MRTVWIFPEGVERGAHSSSDAFNPGVSVGDSSDRGTSQLSDGKDPSYSASDWLLLMSASGLSCRVVWGKKKTLPKSDYSGVFLI